MRNSSQRQNGFTLIELLSATAIIGVILTLAIPTVATRIQRARVTGAVGEVATLLQQARQEAVRTGSPVVVRLTLEDSTLFAFMNLDEDPDLSFDPVQRAASSLGDETRRPGQEPSSRAAGSGRTAPSRNLLNGVVDYEVGRVRLAPQVEFGGVATAGEKEHRKEQVGFTRPRSGGRRVAVFLPDGSIEDTGAFRIHDSRSNVFEVRVGPKASATITVLKYHDAPPWGSPPGFFPRGRHQGTDTPLWEWK